MRLRPPPAGRHPGGPGGLQRLRGHHPGAHEDREALVRAIDSLMTGRRTAIGSGILTVIDAIAENDPRSRGRPSRGGPACAPVPVVAGRLSRRPSSWCSPTAPTTGARPVDAAQQAAERGIRVYTIGYGTAAGGDFSATCDLRFMGASHRASRVAVASGRRWAAAGSGGASTSRRSWRSRTRPAARTTPRRARWSWPVSCGPAHEQSPSTRWWRSASASSAWGRCSAAGLLLGRAWRPLP